MNVRLHPVSDDRYQEWLELSVGGLLSGDEAQALPDIRWIHGQTLRIVRDEVRGVDVGFVWYGQLASAPVDTRSVHHVVIREDERGKGYGSAALRAVEEELRRVGVSQILLEVAPGNRPAVHVSQSSGFEQTAIRLKKRL